MTSRVLGMIEIPLIDMEEYTFIFGCIYCSSSIDTIMYVYK